ncbi:MAG: hypothetical protein ACXVCE_13910, partial [Bacteriovorax sp.]
KIHVPSLSQFATKKEKNKLKGQRDTNSDATSSPKIVHFFGGVYSSQFKAILGPKTSLSFYYSPLSK